MAAGESGDSSLTSSKPGPCASSWTKARRLARWLFWRAALRFRGDGPSRALAITAFAFSIALWAAFCVTLEAFIAFEEIGEGTFQTLLSANLLSLLALCLLPDA